MNSNSIKKPVSLWIVQIFFLSGCIFGIYKIVLLFTHIIEYPQMFNKSMLYILARVLLFLSIDIFIVIGIQLKNKFSRWIAFTWIIIVSFISLIDTDSGPFKIYPDEKFGAILAQVIIFLLLILLAYKIGFGGNVKKYFQK